MSVITKKQVQTLQIARRQVETNSHGQFDDSSYRLLLRNCGAGADVNGRISTKLLDQAGFEMAMAILEDNGYRHPDSADDHWRQRCSYRTGRASSRQIFEIKRLAAIETRYPLSVLCKRVSNDTHTEPEQLTPRQAFKLTEALKAIVERNAGAAC